MVTTVTNYKTKHNKTMFDILCDVMYLEYNENQKWYKYVMIILEIYIIWKANFIITYLQYVQKITISFNT